MNNLLNSSNAWAKPGYASATSAGGFSAKSECVVRKGERGSGVYLGDLFCWHRGGERNSGCYLTRRLQVQIEDMQ
jgi:hypothetical protein